MSARFGSGRCLSTCPHTLGGSGTARGTAGPERAGPRLRGAEEHPAIEDRLPAAPPRLSRGSGLCRESPGARRTDATASGLVVRVRLARPSPDDSHRPSGPLSRPPGRTGRVFVSVRRLIGLIDFALSAATSGRPGTSVVPTTGGAERGRYGPTCRCGQKEGTGRHPRRGAPVPSRRVVRPPTNHAFSPIPRWSAPNQSIEGLLFGFPAAGPAAVRPRLRPGRPDPRWLRRVFSRSLVRCTLSACAIRAALPRPFTHEDVSWAPGVACCAEFFRPFFRRGGLIR